MKKILKTSFLLSLFSLFMMSCASNWAKNNVSVATDDEEGKSRISINGTGENLA